MVKVGGCAKPNAGFRRTDVPRRLAERRGHEPADPDSVQQLRDRRETTAANYARAGFETDLPRVEQDLPAAAEQLNDGGGCTRSADHG